MKITRRSFTNSLMGGAIAATSSLPSLGSALAAGKDAVLTDDGLHYQPWFLESFLELADDHSTASDSGKHFAIMWELKNCPYCAKTHEVNLADQKISSFIQENFDVLQLNVIGSRKVMDFDGEELSEKKLAKKYGVRFTPTIQFFPKEFKDLESVSPLDREIARLPGYMEPNKFLSIFQYVASETYKTKSLNKYLSAG
ncbi:MAG: thioredoxin family protein [Sneathiella sp.]